MKSVDSEARLSSERGKNHLVPLFSTLMIIMLLASLSQMVLSSALPTIAGELHGVQHMMWIITAYMLASTIMMPIYGKLSDLFGRKPLLIAAIVLFVAGSVTGGLAHNINGLVIGRLIQGLGGGGLIILSQAAVADAVPARERGKYMGAMGGVFAFSSVAGPLLGGWFTEGPGWRWAFWMNLPIGILALVAIFTLMKSTHERDVNLPRTDYTGSAMLVIATSTIILIATFGGSTYKWISPEIFGLAVASVVFGILFVIVELRAVDPVIPMYLFKERNFVVATFAGLLIAVAMFGAVGYLPTYFQMAEGISASKAGLLMIPMMVPLLATSVIAGVLVSKSGKYRVLPIVGSVILAIGLVTLSTISLTTPIIVICVDMAIMGIGLGMSMQILTLVVQNTFPHKIVGTATAANNYFRQVGSSLGAAIVGSIFVSRLTSLLTQRLPKGAMAGGASNQLTPGAVNSLPSPIRTIIVTAYNDALIPIFIYMVPLGILAAALLYFIQEKPLAIEIEHEIVAESLAEGQVLITEFEDDK